MRLIDLYFVEVGYGMIRSDVVIAFVPIVNESEDDERFVGA